MGLCVRLYNASSIVLFDLRASRSSHEVPYPSISPLSLAPTGRALSRVTEGPLLPPLVPMKYSTTKDERNHLLGEAHLLK